MKLEIGEKVKIKTFGKNAYPTWWVHEMKDLAGKIAYIKAIREKSHLPYNIHGTHWAWKESDFEKIGCHLPEELFEI